MVAINHNANNGSGSVTLRYQDLDQLDLIVERLSAHQNRRSDTFGALDGGPAEAEAADEDGEWDAPLPDEVDLTAGIDPTRPRPTAPDEEGIAEPAGEAADGSDLDGDDPTDTRWDFDDDDEDDDPLIPKT